MIKYKSKDDIMGNKINVNMCNLFSISVDAGTTISEIVKDYKKVTGKCVMGAKINNLIVDFDTVLTEDVRIDFFDYKDSEGNKIYQSGLKFVTLLAVRELWNKNVQFKYSLDKGIYTEIDKKLSDEDIEELKIKMREIVNYDFQIRKRVTKRKDAITYYLSTGDTEKATNISNLPNGYVELYEVNHVYNYFYSDMPNSTGELGLFDIERVSKNSVILLYPKAETKWQIPKFNFNEKIYDELLKYNKWTKYMGIESVASLNKLVSESKIQKFIMMNDIFINDSHYVVAKDIVKKSKNVKMILIGGPSSSGKTTTAHRLCTYLETFGVKPIVISADDYFKDRDESPVDEHGNLDFECLDAIDLKLFNTQMKKLLNREEVKMPTYNFIIGEKEYIKEPIKLEDDNVLLIEGLHCLNDAMTKSISRDNKYKILVCPFTPLGLDKHNHLSTTDMRLMRRIVRDNRMRGSDVEDTLKTWPQVKTGEEKYIYPYMGDVDAVLNTAYAYEVGILKVYVEPLLYSVPLHSVHYEEARRLLGLLKTFYPINSEYISSDNTLREFIGGSIYEGRNL